MKTNLVILVFVNLILISCSSSYVISNVSFQPNTLQGPIIKVIIHSVKKDTCSDNERFLKEDPSLASELYSKSFNKMVYNRKGMIKREYSEPLKELKHYYYNNKGLLRKKIEKFNIAGTVSETDYIYNNLKCYDIVDSSKFTKQWKLVSENSKVRYRMSKEHVVDEFGKTEYSYNKNGQLISINKEDSSLVECCYNKTKEELISMSKPDPNNEWIKQNYYNSDGKLLYQLFIQYNEIDTLISNKYDSGRLVESKKSHYDDVYNDTKTVEKYPEQGVRLIFYYDLNKKLIKKEKIHFDSQIQYPKEKWIYDGQNILIKHTKAEIQDGKVLGEQSNI